MIWESMYWKKPLLRAASWLEKVKIDDETYEQTLVKVEKEVFFGFYAIRKLLDTLKVSDKTKNMSFSLKWYPCIKSVDYMNAHRIYELYELEKEGEEHRDIAYLCNQFVHSYVFQVVQNDKGNILGFFVSSDKTKQKKMYFISIENVILAFRTVGKDYPCRLGLVRNPTTGQWEGIVE